MEESAEGFADDLARGGVVGRGACFGGGAQFWVEAYGHNFSGAGDELERRGWTSPATAR